ncbi:unnamed protein product [Arabis nemorensis]|uniref:Retrotransposon gag domain-containing protein n=1 Tax=Arabis nemorensis TaxID=586526 RepID=A0A565BC82_9BRAS|nr:unnamed protein product [Arabis nemorensis]
MGWRPREEATVHPREKVIVHWQERLGGLTQGMRPVGEYHREFMLLRDAVKCTLDPDMLARKFWDDLRAELREALDIRLYPTMHRLASDAALLENTEDVYDPARGEDMPTGRRVARSATLDIPIPSAQQTKAFNNVDYICMPRKWLDAYRRQADLSIKQEPRSRGRRMERLVGRVGG